MSADLYVFPLVQEKAESRSLAHARAGGSGDFRLSIPAERLAALGGAEENGGWRNVLAGRGRDLRDHREVTA